MLTMSQYPSMDIEGLSYKVGIRYIRMTMRIVTGVTGASELVRKIRGVPFRKCSDGTTIDNQRFVIIGHLSCVTSVCTVVFQQRGQGAIVSEVIDCHHIKFITATH